MCASQITDARDCIVFDGTDLTAANVAAIAERRCDATLGTAGTFVARIRRGAAFLDELLASDGVIYGVTTGYGDSCGTVVPQALVDELPQHLYTFHGCGLGELFDPVETRAILAARLASLARGYSGVRYELLEQIAGMLRHDILPRIPREGSVGASGDLTPLSYLAAAIAGEREVLYRGEVCDAATALSTAGMRPLKLRPKEGLAVMNGTAVMTALACLALERADYLCQLATRVTALGSLALLGNAHHFDPVLFSVKPHPEQNAVAARIHDDLAAGDAPVQSPRLQDRYSLRCAPHVIGVAADALPWLRGFVETELNSANDNPIVDADGGHVLHGGHFYGGHVALAMDTLKNTVANIADLLDRQLAQLVDPKFNHGLPANLSAARGERASLGHGFKAVQIGASAWTAEALKLTMPASVFSRSTECHNQDKVSLGTIAARDCLRVLELTEQVTAAALLAASHGVQLRIGAGEIDAASTTPAVSETVEQALGLCPLLEVDRALDSTLRATLSTIRNRQWRLYD